ncbi:hypothetical protein NKH77_55970 [Streptomyces sp. M19]
MWGGPSNTAASPGVRGRDPRRARLVRAVLRRAHPAARWSRAARDLVRWEDAVVSMDWPGDDAVDKERWDQDAYWELRERALHDLGLVESDETTDQLLHRYCQKRIAECERVSDEQHPPAPPTKGTNDDGRRDRDHGPAETETTTAIPQQEPYVPEALGPPGSRSCSPSTPASRSPRRRRRARRPGAPGGGRPLQGLAHVLHGGRARTRHRPGARRRQRAGGVEAASLPGTRPPPGSAGTGATWCA